MRPTVMEVDLNKFLNNIVEIKRYVGNKTIIPVIKANAYGTYINKNLSIINQFDIVAVAMLDEAIDLRNIGYKKGILVLNQPYIDDLDDITKYDITVGISDESFLDEVVRKGVKIIVHLEIETGMNRTGIKLDNLQSFIDKAKSSSNIIVEGVYTHLSSADFDSEYTNRQLDLFKKAVSIVNDSFKTIKYIHSSASNGLLLYDDGISNTVRPGIIMYGYESFDGAKEHLKIEPITRLKSKVTFIKDVDKGEAISYSQKFIADKKMKIATIPIGYADGVRRSLGNTGHVVIDGKLCNIVGTICMDSLMVDVSEIDNAYVGMDVFLWDNDIITVDAMAKQCDTINYEIISTISQRVRRDFIL